MKISDFDFPLPEDLIAYRPLNNRDNSRLFVLHKNGFTEHKSFKDIVEYFEPGDLIIINNTKVFPARLTGTNKHSKTIEILLVKKIEPLKWEILSKGHYTGELYISKELSGYIYNGNIIKFNCTGNFMEIIWKYGNMPLPPYIKRKPDEQDKITYQSIFAKEVGSIAAPTASLHFTQDIIEKIKSKNISIREITLHIGIGTFKPIRTSNVEEHIMDKEYFEIDINLIKEINERKLKGNRIICVGTTTARAVEGLMSKNCEVYLKNNKYKGFTNLFIYPGYSFKVVDSLITNFHLPRSTPLLLVSALCGREKLLSAYKEAISMRYRFLSYGDAMLIL
jgi:S-adenosylmethionine:tRNA ribosyltransferase-isomerase